MTVSAPAEVHTTGWGRRGHLIVALVGLVILVLCGLAAHNGKVGSAEESVFHWINDLPDWLYRPMWVFQQFGNVVVAFAIVLVIAAVIRSPRLAISAVVVVIAKLGLERLVKQFVERERPGTSIGITEINRHGNVPASGLSFVSGHAVITAAMATILMPYLPRRWRWVPWVFVVLNGVARIYVGAHNPLDIVGGIGLGLFIGGVVNFFLAPTETARVRKRPTPEQQAADRRVHLMLEDPRRSLIYAGILLAGALILTGLVWSTAARDVLQSIDDWFLDRMISIRSTPLNGIARTLAFMGGAIITWIVRGGVIVILLRRRQWLHLTAFALAVVTSEVLITVMKASLDRPRPAHSLVGTSGASFPSGHAVAAAVTAVGIVIALLPPGHKRWKWERWAAFWASLMAVSRTYLGAHWLSDVVAGALLGSAIALGWPALLVLLRARREVRRGEVPFAASPARTRQ